jgi:hypothetical protein
VKGRLGRQRSVALFAAGVLMFNFPLLALWDSPLRVAGLPLFPLALFLLWAGVIGLLGWLSERSAD